MASSAFSIDALIVAAGTSSRFGGVLSKPYHTLYEKPVLVHAIMFFLENPLINRVIVVINPEEKARYEKLREFLGDRLPAFIEGGEERQYSVKNGLDALKDTPPRFIAIHDAARPFATGKLLRRMLVWLDEHPKCRALIPVWPVSDSLKRLSPDGGVIKHIDRKNIYSAQTPQIFDFSALYQAHESCHILKSDDAALVEESGVFVETIAGEKENMKLTYASDLPNSPIYCETVTGFGVDIHRTKTGDHVILCGIKIPAPFALKGHSDADAGLHALCDAILGTLAEGDIGTHFPPNDSQWKDAPSSLFLDYCLLRLKKRSAQLVHIDMTFLCEEPKILPHREAMQEKLHTLTKLSQERISIKATTNEGLGSLGRGEGVMVYSHITVKFTRLSLQEPIGKKSKE